MEVQVSNLDQFGEIGKNQSFLLLMLHSELTTFSSTKFGMLGVITINGEPWFNGNNVASALRYSSPTEAVKQYVDDKDKLMPLSETCRLDDLRSFYRTVLINKSGLNSLIHSSGHECADKFRQWVYSEIIPQICKADNRTSAGAESDKQGILAKALQIAETHIEGLQPKVDYYDNVLASPTCYTMTQVAKDTSLTVFELQNFLMKKKIIYRSQSGPFMLYKSYLKKGYEAYRTCHVPSYQGEPSYNNSYLVWTERGREFIHSMVNAAAGIAR